MALETINDLSNKRVYIADPEHREVLRKSIGAIIKDIEEKTGSIFHNYHYRVLIRADDEYHLDYLLDEAEKDLNRTAAQEITKRFAETIEQILSVKESYDADKTQLKIAFEGMEEEPKLLEALQQIIDQGYFYIDLELHRSSVYE